MTRVLAFTLLGWGFVAADEPYLEVSTRSTERCEGGMVDCIPSVIVTAKETVLAYSEVRKCSKVDRGEIENLAWLNQFTHAN